MTYTCDFLDLKCETTSRNKWAKVLAEGAGSLFSLSCPFNIVAAGTKEPLDKDERGQ